MPVVEAVVTSISTSSRCFSKTDATRASVDLSLKQAKDPGSSRRRPDFGRPWPATSGRLQHRRRSTHCRAEYGELITGATSPKRTESTTRAVCAPGWSAVAALSESEPNMPISPTSRRCPQDRRGPAGSELHEHAPLRGIDAAPLPAVATLSFTMRTCRWSMTRSSTLAKSSSSRRSRIRPARKGRFSTDVLALEPVFEMNSSYGHRDRAYDALYRLHRGGLRKSM